MKRIQLKIQNQTIKTPNSIFKMLFGHNYYYDDTGVIGMKYGGQHYYFVKNLFGDVIEIWDANGTYVGGYGYDAYGNTKVADRTAAKIATANPFRYRGYYQDGIGSTDSVYFDKGLYYLKSRYYDPSILSFISADDPTMALLGASQIGGTNLYAYCNYDPINYTDPVGYGIGFLTLVAAVVITSLIGGVVGGGISAVSTWVNGGSGKEIGAAFVGGSINGFLTTLGAGIGFGFGGVGGAAIGGGFGGLFGGLFGDMATQAISNGSVDYKQAWINAGISAVFGTIAGLAGGFGVKGLSPKGIIASTLRGRLEQFFMPSLANILAVTLGIQGIQLGGIEIVTRGIMNGLGGVY